jgi:hypothetical protein
MGFMDLIGWVKFRKAAFVSTRAELVEAMRREPPRIVVDGDEALRAYAARVVMEGAIADTGDQAEPLAPPPGTAPAYMAIPTVGRIRDGYRKPRKPKQRSSRLQLRGGMDSVFVAGIGVTAALLMEWLSFPDDAPRIIRVAHHAGTLPPAHGTDWAVLIAIPLLGIIALTALGWVVWQGLGLGRRPETGWRIEHRVPGRLIMARVRRRSV